MVLIAGGDDPQVKRQASGSARVSILVNHSTNKGVEQDPLLPYGSINETDLEGQKQAAIAVSDVVFFFVLRVGLLTRVLVFLVLFSFFLKPSAPTLNVIFYSCGGGEQG